MGMGHEFPRERANMTCREDLIIASGMVAAWPWACDTRSFAAAHTSVLVAACSCLRHTGLGCNTT